MKNKKIIYSAVMLSEETKKRLLEEYKPSHNNIYCHHSTIEFRPTHVSHLPLGDVCALHITGLLRTDKIDVLLVDNPLSLNKYPHITLSTADGIKPFESNSEIQNNQSLIVPLNDTAFGTINLHYED